MQITYPLLVWEGRHKRRNKLSVENVNEIYFKTQFFISLHSYSICSRLERNRQASYSSWDLIIALFPIPICFLICIWPSYRIMSYVFLCPHFPSKYLCPAHKHYTFVFFILKFKSYFILKNKVGQIHLQQSSFEAVANKSLKTLSIKSLAERQNKKASINTVKIAYDSLTQLKFP